jgi:hypothetical protein
MCRIRALHGLDITSAIDQQRAEMVPKAMEAKLFHPDGLTSPVDGAVNYPQPHRLCPAVGDQRWRLERD